MPIQLTPNQQRESDRNRRIGGQVDIGSPNAEINQRGYTAYAPQQQTLAKDIYDSNMSRGASYRSNMQSMSDSVFNPIAAGERAQLAQNIKGVKGSYNSRGLLHSGGTEASIAGENNASEQKLSAARNQINQGLLSNADTIDNNSFGMASTLAQPGAMTANNYEKWKELQLAKNEKDAQKQSAMYGNISSGAGYAGGYGLGSAFGGWDSSYG